MGRPQRVVARRYRERDAAVRRFLAAADVLGVVVAMAIALLVLTHHQSEFLWGLALLPAWILIFKTYGLYDRDLKRISHRTLDDLPWIFHAVLMGSLLLLALLPAPERQRRRAPPHRQLRRDRPRHDQRLQGDRPPCCRVRARAGARRADGRRTRARHPGATSSRRCSQYGVRAAGPGLALLLARAPAATLNGELDERRGAPRGRADRRRPRGLRGGCAVRPGLPGAGARGQGQRAAAAVRRPRAPRSRSTTWRG